MSEKIIDRRKSQLFLHNLSPVTNTLDDLIKKKLTCGKFPITKTGIIKMVGLMILLGSIVSFLMSENTCTNKDYSNVFICSASVGTAGEIVLFLIFSFGVAARKPGLWIKTDILFNVIIGLVTIVSASLSLKFCQEKSGLASKVSEGLGICGSGILLFISCPALFLMYRFVEYIDPSDPRAKNQEDFRKNRKSFMFRKSIFA